MEIHIGVLNSTVRAVDGNSILTPEIMQQILQTVLRAVREQEEHGNRVRRNSASAAACGVKWKRSRADGTTRKGDACRDLF